MSGQGFARLSLLASVAIWGAALLVIKFAPQVAPVAFWVAVIAVAGIVTSATSCVAFQMLASIRSKVSDRG